MHEVCIFRGVFSLQLVNDWIALRFYSGMQTFQRRKERSVVALHLILMWAGLDFPLFLFYWLFYWIWEVKAFPFLCSLTNHIVSWRLNRGLLWWPTGIIFPLVDAVSGNEASLVWTQRCSVMDSGVSALCGLGWRSLLIFHFIQELLYISDIDLCCGLAEVN